MIPDYTKYPREFITYKWYRPVFTAILFAVFYLIFGIVLVVAASVLTDGGFDRVTEIAAGGYDSFDVYTSLGATVSLGSVAVMIPALALANLIAGKRTFSSYSSSRGGWNFRIFFKSLLAAFIVCSVPIIVYNILCYGRVSDSRFTTAGFIILTVLGPLQCIAEEYAFRGILMQTIGSWFRSAPLAIVLSSAVFAAVHPYNTLGVINIFIDGCSFCLAAWLTHGLEAGAALHIANNMAIFYTAGFGIGGISSEVVMGDFILSVAIDIVFIAVVILLRKRGVFDEVKRNDAEEYNAKVEARRAGRAVKNSVRTATIEFEAEDPEKE